MRHSRTASLFATALFLVCAVSASAGQVSTGMVAGSVKDVQGGVIPGATVVLINEAQGTKSAPALTNSIGDYVFVNVASGTYTIEVTMNGFKTLKRAGLAVSGGDRLAVGALTIEVGGMTQVVNVTAEAPLVQASSGERSYTVTPEAVQNLPISSRSYIELGSLAPGVQLGVVDPNGNAGAGSYFPPMRLGGGSGVNDTITLDGAGIIDTGGANIRLAPNVDAIAEVKVVTASSQAEYGRGSGVQISGISKSGTNRFHGSIYDIERNSDWNANSWVNAQRGIAKTVNKERDFGYTIGGPVGKPGGANQLFFFYSQELRPRTAAGEQFFYRVPTALERLGDFSQSRDNTGALFPYIRDYTLNQPCSAANTAGCFRDGGVLGRVPANRLYAVGINILNQWPLPNNNDGYAANNSYNYLNVNDKRSGRLVQNSLRFDYQASESLRLTAKTIFETKNKVLNSPNIAFGQSTNHLNGYNDALETQPQQFQYTASANYSINQQTFLEGTWGMFQNQTGSPTMSPVPTIGAFPTLFPNSKIIDPRFYLYDRLKGDAPPWISTDSSGNLLADLPPVFAFGSLVANPPPPYPGWNCSSIKTRSMTWRSA